jgi:preprotein translocase subunit YajC
MYYLNCMYVMRMCCIAMNQARPISPIHYDDLDCDGSLSLLSSSTATEDNGNDDRESGRADEDNNDNANNIEENDVIIANGEQLKTVNEIEDDDSTIINISKGTLKKLVRSTVDEEVENLMRVIKATSARLTSDHIWTREYLSKYALKYYMLIYFSNLHQLLYI